MMKNKKDLVIACLKWLSHPFSSDDGAGEFGNSKQTYMYNRTEYETSIHAIHSLHPTYHQKYMPYQMPSIL